MAGNTDYYELVMKMPRPDFVARCPFPFLVGGNGIRRPAGPARTIQFDKTDLTAPLAAQPAPPLARPIVLAIRKVQDMFPSMITVGRTSNNDVFVEDVQVSKFHAAFKVDGERIELSDHNSRNGTFVAGERLAAGTPREVHKNEVVRFGNVEFDLVDAAGCWDRVRRPPR
jgi:pSer/pThr/pTyr-binding forkhead associated (FHA) protein